MSWLIGQSSALGEVAAKAVLMYLTALVALRLGERRTLAQWTLIDFATAVAMGAIIGRSAIAGSQSYITGAVAVCTLVVVHRAVSLLRFRPLLGKLVDHRVRVLVADGELRRGELRRCGVTDNDLFTQPLSVNVRRDAHDRGITDLEGENGARWTWRRARMEPNRLLSWLPPAPKTREA